MIGEIKSHITKALKTVKNLLKEPDPQLIDLTFEKVTLYSIYGEHDYEYQMWLNLKIKHSGENIYNYLTRINFKVEFRLIDDLIDILENNYVIPLKKEFPQFSRSFDFLRIK